VALIYARLGREQNPALALTVLKPLSDSVNRGDFSATSSSHVLRDQSEFYAHSQEEGVDV